MLSAASNYQQFSAHVATALGATDANWELTLAANRDLAAVVKRNTGSGASELFVLSAASTYQGFSQGGSTAFPQDGRHLELLPQLGPGPGGRQPRADRLAHHRGPHRRHAVRP